MVAIPAAQNYPQQWTSMPANLNRPAPEGQRQIAFEVPWATMGGTNNAVAFNVGSGSVAPLSQICSLAVDNSDCGMDIRFIFPDTGNTVTVPAGANSLIIPVFTNQTQFICVATINNEAEEPLDVTRFTVLNFVPPPIAVPPTTAQELGAQGFQGVDGATTLTVIAANDPNYASGSVAGVEIRYDGLTIAGGRVQFKLVDGTGRNIAWFGITVGNGTVVNLPLVSMFPVDIRYSGGLFIQQVGTNIGGELSYSIPVKLP